MPEKVGKDFEAVLHRIDGTDRGSDTRDTGYSITI